MNTIVGGDHEGHSPYHEKVVWGSTIRVVASEGIHQTTMGK